MKQGHGYGRRGAVALLVAVLAGLVPLAAAEAAGAQASGPKPKAADNVSPGLDALATKGVTTSSDAAESRAAGLPGTGAGSLLHQPDGTFLANARLTTVDAATEAALAGAGARITARSTADHLVTLALDVASIEAVAAVPGVEWLEEVLEPRVGRADLQGVASALGEDGVATSASCSSRITSEGDTQLGAATARTTFGVDGTGIKIGVLSDSYDNLGGAATDVSNGELPGAANPCGYTTPVVVQSDKASGGSDEGRAMAQAVHDLAPGATIMVATAFNGDVDFANQIRNLAAAGAKVIVDDISYFNEPMYQDGIIAKAIADVTAQGVTYFSSAANSNVILGGRDVASYEAGAYRPAACPTSVASSVTDCHDWDPGAGVDAGDLLTVGAGGELLIKLGYNEPQYGITTDLDLFLVDNATGSVVASAVLDNVGTSRQAYELLSFTNPSGTTKAYRLVVGRYGGSTPRFKLVFMTADGLTSVQWNTSSGTDVVGPTSYGHNMMRGAGSIAAIRYNTSSAPESFSSRGPVTYCWNPVSGTTAASALPSCVTDTIDITATNGAANSFFGSLSGSVYRFYGTSQAAPHAAAVAVLQLAARPCRTPAEVLAAQRSSGIAIGSYGVDAVGGGRLNATNAINGLTGCQPLAGAPGTPTGTPGNGQATLTWSTPTYPGSTPITGYRVTPYLGTTAQTATTFSSTATTQTVTGLANGSSYTFTVAAVNGSGPGTESAASAAITPRTVPGAPTGVTASAGSSQATVSWTPPLSNGGTPITGYTVTPYIGAQAQTASEFDATATTRVIGSLTNGTSYTFKVRANNVAGTSADSAASAAVTPVTTPSAPTITGATPGNGQVTLTWSAPTSSGGTPVTGYVVTPRIGSTPQPATTFDSTATTQTVTGLTNGTAYGFTVQAVNGAGTGAASGVFASVTPRTVPGAPTGVTGVAGNQQVTVSWTAPASDGGSAITGYTVTPYLGADAQPGTTFASTATTQTVSGLVNGNVYTFTVEAINGAGTGAASAPSAAVTPVAPVIPWAPFASWGALVDQVYRDLLGRAPSASERSTRIGQLTAGSLTPGGLVAALRLDADNVGNVDPVTRLYRAYFLRIPDKGGLEYWIRQRRLTGKKLNVISDSFARSNEFKTKYGTLTNRAFVERIYVNVLGRPGEKSGVDYWTSRLDRKVSTRGQVMTGFSESNEYKTKQVSEVHVSVLYLLLKGKAPTQTEFDQLVAALDAGTTTPAAIATTILASPEYAAKVGG